MKKGNKCKIRLHVCQNDRTLRILFTNINSYDLFLEIYSTILYISLYLYIFSVYFASVAYNFKVLDYNGNSLNLYTSIKDYFLKYKDKISELRGASKFPFLCVIKSKLEK